MTAADLQDVTVKVPADRLGEFYAWFGRWLERSEQSDEPDPEVRPWDPAADVELATSAWIAFPDRAKALLGQLIDYPSAQLSGDDLARMHDIPHGKHGVAGVLAWPGRQLRKVGRPIPIEVSAAPGGGSSYYSMQPRLARLFAEARRRATEA